MNIRIIVGNLMYILNLVPLTKQDSHTLAKLDFSSRLAQDDLKPCFDSVDSKPKVASESTLIVSYHY